MSAITTHWALLIGINFNVESPLKGCVSDVKLMKTYLEARPTPTETIVLTASAPLGPSPRCLAEEPDLWPTYENVTSGLAKITAEAKPGNFVYIHYSGHGTLHTIERDVKLVLFDEVRGSRYLPGSVLSAALQKMVAKGLFVTLVLDCCFSGRIMRHGDRDDAGIRSVDYDPAIDAAYLQSTGGADSQKSGTKDTVPDFRDGRLLQMPKWLTDPRGYTILTACGPLEEAKELKTGNGQNDRNGALSFFLLHTLIRLAEVGEEITHKTLHDYLCSQFRTFWPTQNPMRYGDGKLTFFGDSRPGLGLASIPVFIDRGTQLCLRAGRAHGVLEGDEYVAYPLNPGKGGANLAPATVRVDALHGLSSDLSVINPAQSKIEAGWKAIPLVHRSPRDFNVRLDELGDNLQWIEAAGERRYLNLRSNHGEEYNCDCVVTRNGCNEYEILDKSGTPIPGLPTTAACREGAMNQVLELLEHLAAFRTARAIRNQDSATTFDEFSIRISGDIMATVGDTHEVSHKNVITIEVQNNSCSPLYLFIYDLGPSWNIDSLISENGGGDYDVVGPREEKDVPLEMAVPQDYIDRGKYECEDVVKVFITNQPTSFEMLQLPAISASNLRPTPSQNRGDCQELSQFTFPRSVHDERWAVRDFVIRTRYTAQ